MPDSFQIVLDARWLASFHVRMHSGEWVTSAPSLPIEEAAASGVDLVVGGRSATGFLEREPIVPLLLALSDALVELGSGRRAKILVAFATAPWELALEMLDAERVALTIYQVVAPGEVTVDATPLPLERVVEGVASAAERVADGLATTRVAGASDVADRLRRTVSRLRRGRVAAIPRASGAPASVPIRVETSSSVGLLLTTQFDATSADLLGYDGSVAVDRHVLRARGELTLSAEQGGGARGVARPLVVLDELLRRLSLRLSLDASPERVWPLIEVEGLRVGFEPGAVQAALVIERPRRDALRVEGSARELLLALIEHTGQVFEAARACNAWLEANLVFIDTLDRVDELRSLIDGAIPASRVAPTPPGSSPAAPVEPPASDAAWDEAASLAYRSAWRREIVQVVPDGVVPLPGNALLVRTTSRLLALASASGDLLWERNVPASVERHRVFVLGDRIYADVPRVGLLAIEAATGRELARSLDPLQAAARHVLPWGEAADALLVVGTDGGARVLASDGSAGPVSEGPAMLADGAAFVTGPTSAVLAMGGRIVDLSASADPLGRVERTPQTLRRALPFDVAGAWVRRSGDAHVLWSPTGEWLWSRSATSGPGTPFRRLALCAGVRALAASREGLWIASTDPEADAVAEPGFPARTIVARLPTRLASAKFLRPAPGDEGFLVAHAGEQLEVLTRRGRTLARMRSGVVEGTGSFGWVTDELSLVVGHGAHHVDARATMVLEGWVPSQMLVPLA